LKATENPGSELHTVRVPDKLVPLFREAQHYVAEYFADQRSAPERGTLEISGQRYMLVRAASMSVEFHDMVKSFYAEEQEASAVAHALLFDVAHAMGLADAKAFAERMQVVNGHRGAIRIESREGVGTRASVLLPVKYERSSSIPVTGDGKRGTILVVDDDNGVRTMVRRCLAVAGYHTLQAADGAEGVQLFERHKDEVLLVVMDVDMPGMNGFEAVDRIRALAPAARILMSSGYRVEPAEIERRQLSGLLEKPYDMERLRRSVEQALAQVTKP